MKIDNVFDITKKKNDSGEIILTCAPIGRQTVWFSSVSNPELYAELSALYLIMNRFTESQRGQKFRDALKNDSYPNIAKALKAAGIDDTSVITPNAETGVSELMNFFSEFQFEPNFRFLNTLIRTLNKSGEKKGKEYIYNYFALSDSPYKQEIDAKMKSPEFKSILTHLSAANTNKQINTRFKIYYGPQGTGKTFTATKEADNRCIICNSSMLPADLMEDFGFDEGNPNFHHSALWDCMEKGLPIVLDEINLLSFDSLRFLQGLLDNKEEFLYKNVKVHIKDGFKIIGTMNLSINGMTYGLPEPLIDRCEEIKSFKLTAADLLASI